MVAFSRGLQAFVTGDWSLGRRWLLSLRAPAPVPLFPSAPAALDWARGRISYARQPWWRGLPL